MSPRVAPRGCAECPQRVTGAFPERPRGVPRVSPAAMESPRSPELFPSLLEPLVTVVDTLGKLVAAVAGMGGVVPLAVPPRSLQADLEAFMRELQTILCDHSVTLRNVPGVTSLGEALAALGATPGDTWAKVEAAASAWRDPLAELGHSWAGLLAEVTKLCDACGDAATAEATAKATTEATARDLQDKVTRLGTAGNKLGAAACQLPGVLDKEEAASALAKHEARVGAATEKLVAATKAMEEAVVAASQARAATVRAQRAEVALELLLPLVDACVRATALPRELLRRLGDIEAALQGTKEAAPDVPQALVAAVAEAELLWEASALLVKDHLLGTFNDVQALLFAGPGGPGGHSVAEQCKKAIEAIPKLLQGQ